MQLPPASIRQDGGTQVREYVECKHIDRYASLLRDGATLPEPIVFHDGTHYWLADGFHRLRAWVAVYGDQPIECEIKAGNLADAQEFSCAANQEHDTAGIPRTKGDIGRAIELLLKLPKWGKASVQEIADHIGCNQTTASRHRRKKESTQAVPKSPLRTGKDGRTINTAKIGKSRKTRRGTHVERRFCV